MWHDPSLYHFGQTEDHEESNSSRNEINSDKHYIYLQNSQFDKLSQAEPWTTVCTPQEILHGPVAYNRDPSNAFRSRWSLPWSQPCHHCGTGQIEWIVNKNMAAGARWHHLSSYHHIIIISSSNHQIIKSSSNHRIIESSNHRIIMIMIIIIFIFIFIYHLSSYYHHVIYHLSSITILSSFASFDDLKSSSRILIESNHWGCKNQEAETSARPQKSAAHCLSVWSKNFQDYCYRPWSSISVFQGFVSMCIKQIWLCRMPETRIIHSVWYAYIEPEKIDSQTQKIE